MVPFFKQLGRRQSKKCRRLVPINHLFEDGDPKLVRRLSYLDHWCSNLPARKVKHRIADISRWLGFKPSYTGPFWKKRYACWTFKYGRRVFCLKQFAGGLELFVNGRITPVMASQVLNTVYVKVRMGKIMDHKVK